MTDLLEGVDQRTQLAGQNRLELLLFYLHDHQRFAINVFKVQEVMHCPELTRVPGSTSVVAGIATIRGKTITVIDLNKALDNEPVDPRDSFLIVSEYNRGVQGFLVNGVDRIVNMNWKDVVPPPDGAAKKSYLTAVTHVEDKLVGIIDVERILSEIVDVETEIQSDLRDRYDVDRQQTILVVDDSMVARNQVKKTFEQLSVTCFMASNGQEALDMLKDWAENQPEKLAGLSMVLSDIEMPIMDGYTLTTAIKDAPALKHLYVMLHSSLSGVFNQAMVKKVGADFFVPKFDSNDLVEAFLQQVGMAEQQEAIA